METTRDIRYMSISRDRERETERVHRRIGRWRQIVRQMYRYIHRERERGDGVGVFEEGGMTP